MVCFFNVLSSYIWFLLLSLLKHILSTGKHLTWKGRWCEGDNGELINTYKSDVFETSDL